MLNMIISITSANHGLRAFKTFEVLEALGLEAAAAQQDDHAEGRGRHQHVGERVEHRGRKPFVACRR